MQLRLTLWFERITSSYWALPGLMTVGALALALGTVSLDAWLARQGMAESLSLFPVGAEGARAVLGTLAGSMITVAGVVFSITIVALTLAASQFGPRLLLGYMRDRGNQVVLGTFIATFVYSLAVLRVVRGGEDAAFVPHVALAVALVLGLASVGVLIYFIHHASVSIQAGHVIQVAARDLEKALTRSFPALGEEEEEEAGETPVLETEGAGVVPASRAGYVEEIDDGALVALAEERGLRLFMDLRRGDFVLEDGALARVESPEAVDEELVEKVQDAVLVTSRKTSPRDLERAVGQVVEIAVRALSPGLNDPYTAKACLDRLGAALVLLAERREPSPVCRGEDGEVRLVRRTDTFRDALDRAFDPIRHYGASDPDVTVRLLEVLRALGAQARDPKLRSCVARHVEKTSRAAAQALTLEDERDRVAAAVREARAVLREG